MSTPAAAVRAKTVRRREATAFLRQFEKLTGPQRDTVFYLLVGEVRPEVWRVAELYVQTALESEDDEGPGAPTA